MKSPDKPSGTEPIISSLCLFNCVNWHSVGGLEDAEDSSIIQAARSCHMTLLRVCLLCPFFLSFLEAGSTCLSLSHPQAFSRLPGSLQHSVHFSWVTGWSWHGGPLTRLTADVFVLVVFVCLLHCVWKGLTSGWNGHTKPSSFIS